MSFNILTTLHRTSGNYYYIVLKGNKVWGVRWAVVVVVNLLHLVSCRLLLFCCHLPTHLLVHIVIFFRIIKEQPQQPLETCYFLLLLICTTVCLHCIRAESSFCSAGTHHMSIWVNGTRFVASSAALSSCVPNTQGSNPHSGGGRCGCVRGVLTPRTVWWRSV